MQCVYWSRHSSCEVFVEGSICHSKQKNSFFSQPSSKCEKYQSVNNNILRKKYLVSRVDENISIGIENLFNKKWRDIFGNRFFLKLYYFRNIKN